MANFWAKTFIECTALLRYTHADKSFSALKVADETLMLPIPISGGFRTLSPKQFARPRCLWFLFGTTGSCFRKGALCGFA
mgnify:FL=1